MSEEDRPAGPSIPDGLLYALAGLCGFATGIVGAAFHSTVDVLLRWPAWLAGQLESVEQTVLAAAGIAAVAVTLAFLLTRHVAPEASGSGVPEVEGALEGLREVRWRRVLPVKFVGGALGLSSGLVAGREGPTIHMGAAIGAAMPERLKLGRSDLHALLAAGAAAGLAAAFNAPLAAILFVIEETRKEFRYTLRSYVAVIGLRRPAPSAWSWWAAPRRRSGSPRRRCRCFCCRPSSCWVACSAGWECCSTAAWSLPSTGGRRRSGARPSSLPLIVGAGGRRLGHRPAVRGRRRRDPDPAPCRCRPADPELCC